MSLLDGRVALVTGAGRGIGAAVARRLAVEGASVVVNDLGVALDGGRAADEVGETPAEEVVKSIVDLGGAAVADHGDVADHQSARRMVELAVDTYGKLDILINVAGILRDRMIFNMAEEDWDAVIRVHLKGTFNTTKWASAYWRGLRDENAHHRLINFTSGSGLSGAPAQPSYAAAKMGIVGLTFSCANALRRYGVTSNCVAPQAATRMIDVIPAEHQREDHPEGHDQWDPDNVATIVNYIASTRSDWLNGSVVRSQGYQVSLYSNPGLERQLVAPTRWDFEDLATAVEESFRPAVEGRPPSPWARGRS